MRLLNLSRAYSDMIGTQCGYGYRYGYRYVINAYSFERRLSAMYDTYAYGYDTYPYYGYSRYSSYYGYPYYGY